MLNHLKSSLIAVVGILAMVMLAGCPGGSDSAPVGNDPDTNPPTGNGINAGLSGRVYVGDTGSYLDVASGELRQIGGSWLSPSPDGQEYVSVEQDFERRTPSDCDFSQEFDRVSIRNAASGEVVNSFDIPADIWDVRLSPDRQRIGAFAKDASPCFVVEMTFDVFDRDGTRLYGALPESVQGFDWLPDSRLVIASRGGISVETEAGTLRFNRIADLNQITGTPAKLSVDPTGTRILFEMLTSRNLFNSTVQFRDATIWSVNVDGANLRQRVTSTRALQAGSTYPPRVNAPAWSPDGNWFLVTEGYISGGVIDGGSTSPGVVPIQNNGITYIVSADADAIDLPADANESDVARPLNGQLTRGGTGPIRLQPFGRHTWVPAPE